MSIKNRLEAPTPPFFKKLRKWGLVAAASAATLLTAPVALPTVILKIAGYVAVAGAVTSAVSQITTSQDSVD